MLERKSRQAISAFAVKRENINGTGNVYLENLALLAVDDYELTDLGFHVYLLWVKPYYDDNSICKGYAMRKADNRMRVTAIVSTIKVPKNVA